MARVTGSACEHLEHVKAAEIGHLQVEKNGPWLLLLGQAQALAPVLCLDQAEAGACELSLEEVARRLVIVNKQDTPGECPSGPAG